MDLLQALLLSVVEGITEFLPISSTGHLILTSHLLNIPDSEFIKSFEIIIQLGAILAIIVLYWDKLFTLNKEKNVTFDKDYFQSNLRINFNVWGKIFCAFLPTAIIGLIFYSIIKEYLLGNELITVSALFVGGIALIVLEKMHKEKESSATSIENLTIKQAFLIGLAQSISIIPGVSRSAASILGAMYLGAKRHTAVEFSFLLAIPTMLAATALDLIKTEVSFTSDEWALLATGFIGSFIVALIVVKWFVKFVQKNSFIPFGIYRIIISILYFLIILR